MGEGSYCLIGTEFGGGDEEVWGIDSGDGYTTLWTHLMLLICTLTKS